MTKDELITKLSLENEDLKIENKEYLKLFRKILNKFYCIGGALNDNVLNFNGKQKEFLKDIADEIEYTVPRECDC